MTHLRPGDIPASLADADADAHTKGRDEFVQALRSLAGLPDDLRETLVDLLDDASEARQRAEAEAEHLRRNLSQAHEMIRQMVPFARKGGWK
jgi:ABC-type transporter Mla subunit MlaD